MGDNTHAYWTTPTDQNGGGARRLPINEAIGRASLARKNEAGGSWGQEVHILHVNI